MFCIGHKTQVEIKAIKTINNLQNVLNVININIRRVERTILAGSKKVFETVGLRRQSASMDTKTRIPDLMQNIAIQCPVIRVFDVWFFSLEK